MAGAEIMVGVGQAAAVKAMVTTPTTPPGAGNCKFHHPTRENKANRCWTCSDHGGSWRRWESRQLIQFVKEVMVKWKMWFKRTKDWWYLMSIHSRVQFERRGPDRDGC